MSTNLKVIILDKKEFNKEFEMFNVFNFDGLGNGEGSGYIEGQGEGHGSGAGLSDGNGYGAGVDQFCYKGFGGD